MEAVESQGYEIGHLLAIFRRRQAVIYASLIVCMVLAAIYCAVSTRRYEAVGSMQLQKSSADALGLESMMGAADMSSDSLGASVDLQTQVRILSSDTLALKTIENLNMENTQDFLPRRFHFFRASPGSAPQSPIAEDPKRRQRALQIFAKNLRVEPVAGTRMIEIRYMNPDPKLAAAVVNALMQELSDFSFQTRYNAANQTSKWLSDQLDDLRKNSEESQAKVANLERQSGVYSLEGSSDASGHELAYSGVIDRLQQATTALSGAEQNRILKGAIAQAARSGDVDALSSLGGNAIGASGNTNNTMALLQSLRQQEASARAALDQAQAKYGPAYSRLAELRGQLNAVQQAVRDELTRIRSRAVSDYDVAVQVEKGARQHYESAKSEADKLNDKSIEYAIARQDAVESRSLYSDLLRRLKQAGVLESLHSSNITVVDPGRAPSTPKLPNLPLCLALSAVVGLLIGCSGAFALDRIYNKVNSISDLETTLNHSVLGVLPLMRELQEGETRPLMLAAPQSGYAESMRAVRTALLLSQTERPPQAILIVSALPSEGKSTFSSNLAIVLAQQGHKVLLVDSDLRRGAVAKKFGLSSRKRGLSSLLAGMSAEFAPIAAAGVDNLFIVPSGPVPPNPSELLSSAALRACLAQWRREYAFVIFDGSPVLPVTDSVAINELVDSTIMLARAGVVNKTQVKRSYLLLSRSGGHPVNIVLNCLSSQDSSYYSYYGYYGYDAYPYKEDRDDE